MWLLGKNRVSRLRRNLAHSDGFRHRLETDRLRADRMGIALTLVTVRWNPGDDASAATARAFDVVNNRLRATDELGKLADNEIGIVLWDTAEEGAAVFVERLLRDAPGELGFQATLFVYPSRSPAPASEATRSDRSTDDNDDPSDGASDSHAGEAATKTPDSGVPVESLEPAMATATNPVRRVVDFVGASIGLILASPLLIGAAIAIKLSSRGPIFFMQERAGLGGKPFRIYKLRTMCVDAEARKAALAAQNEQDGAAFKITNDPRVFPVGSFLRKTSIDELPQLINVVRGEMSLVGPRPLPVPEAESVAGWQRRRLDVMPGLTCIWQVEGRSRVSFVEWMRMDMKYIQKRSLIEDLRLMFATVPAVLLRRGAK